MKYTVKIPHPRSDQQPVAIRERPAFGLHQHREHTGQRPRTFIEDDQPEDLGCGRNTSKIAETPFGPATTGKPLHQQHQREEPVAHRGTCLAEATEGLQHQGEKQDHSKAARKATRYEYRVLLIFT